MLPTQLSRSVIQRERHAPEKKSCSIAANSRHKARPTQPRQKSQHNSQPCLQAQIHARSRRASSWKQLEAAESSWKQLKAAGSSWKHVIHRHGSNRVMFVCEN